MTKLQRAVSALRQGKMIILVDDEDRENEGDLVIGAQDITPEIMNFMISHARGLVCLPLTAKRLKELHIPMMVPPEKNKAQHGTAFTVSIEAAKGVTTGISAADRARTVAVAADENAKPSDLVSPGHIFPLKAADGGLRERRGHTEGSLDILRLAGKKPVAVICEILNDDGTMSRMPQLEHLSKRFGIPLVSIEEVEQWIEKHGCEPIKESSLEEKPAEEAGDDFIPALAQASLPNAYGGEDFKVFAYEDAQGNDYLALVHGERRSPKDVPLVRLHSECLTGDALGSLRCDCGEQLHKSLQLIGRSDYGVLLYIQGHEGRGIGLINKIKAYELQDQGFDTVESNIKLGFPAEKRNWSTSASILKSMGIKELDLLTNNPRKIEEMKKRGIKVRKHIPLEIPPTRHNHAYLATKKAKMGHDLKASYPQGS